MTPRELVRATLEFRNKDGRVPIESGGLPWAQIYHPEGYAKVMRDFPSDFVGAPVILKKPTIEQGNKHEIGTYIDEWGCRWTNIHRGIVGEIKDPLVSDDDWEDVDNVHIPVELLDFDTEQVNAFCKNTERFVRGECWPNPFERLQHIRSTENLFMDLVDPPQNLLRFMQKMHTFYCDLVEKWVKTDVDYIQLSDDWGSQQSLLINPVLWDELFRPMYQDYIDIAKQHDKKVIMHSDGYTLDIYPRLIEMGLDAFNSQIFCMGVDKLEQFKGKITFHGEIDRQYLLAFGTTEEVEKAVKEVYEKLWCNGGCVAMCEFGAGAKPENVYTVYKTWKELRG